MRITIDESLRFMRGTLEVKDLMIEGIKTMSPNRKLKNRIYTTDDESRAFIKIWGSIQGVKIRAKLEKDLGAHAGVSSAARIYFKEVWEEVQNVRKRD